MAGKGRKVSLDAIRTFREFMRYAVVGGIAFLVDFAVVVLTEECLLKSFSAGVYVAVFLGFVAGLVVNYRLSLRFVFRESDYGRRGRSPAAFAAFGAIGAIGLGLTELGMWLGVAVLAVHYAIVKVVVTALVLMWNYLARRIVVFGEGSGL